MNENEAARIFARMGGKARAKKLSKKRRVEIARLGRQSAIQNCEIASPSHAIFVDGNSGLRAAR